MKKIARFWPVALLVMAAAPGCSKKEEAAPAKGAATQPAAPVAVMVEPVRRGPLDWLVDVTGTLFGDEQATISAKVAGRVDQIHADVGDRLGRNQPLASIESTDYRLTLQQRQMATDEALAKLGLNKMPDESFDVSKIATVERARFQAANAQAKLDRARKLFEQKPPLMSEQDFADIETAYEVAERDQRVALLDAQSQLAQARIRAVEAETAQQRLDDTTIRTPVAPTTQPTPADDHRYAVTEHIISAGEYVREGDPLFRLVADDPIKFRASAPERFVADMKVGQSVWISVDGYSESFEGKVSRINPSINPANRTFEIEAIVPNQSGKLRAGTFAHGFVSVGQEDAVTFVPASAVSTFAGLDRVFTVKDGKAVRFNVNVRPQRDGSVAIDGDLKGADNVVVSGQEKLADGVPVTIQTETASR